MRDHAQRRPPLPVRLTPAERDFYHGTAAACGCRRAVVQGAGRINVRRQIDSGESSFYSKSQWGRWLNGQSRPLRKAVRKLAEKLGEEDIDAEYLVDLWDKAFVLETLGFAGARVQVTVDTLQHIELRNVAMPDQHHDTSLKPFPCQVDGTCPLGRGAGRAAGGGAAHAAARHGRVHRAYPRAGPARAAVCDTPAAGGVVGIHAVDGMAGIGKTAFAVHAAHRLAARFPDGQLFLRLHGSYGGAAAASTRRGAATLLLSTGAAPQQIPPGLEARSAALARPSGRQEGTAGAG